MATELDRVVYFYRVVLLAKCLNTSPLTNRKQKNKIPFYFILQLTLKMMNALANTEVV